MNAVGTFAGWVGSVKRAATAKVFGASIAASALAMGAGDAQAGERDRGRDGSRPKVSVNLEFNTRYDRISRPSHHDHVERIWIEPVYRTVCERVYVAPEYRTVCERIWVEPVVEQVHEKVWIPDRYEERWVTVRDRHGRPTRRLERVLVERGHYETVHHDRVITPGHWDTIERRELVRDGYWKDVERRELVRAGYWEERRVHHHDRGDDFRARIEIGRRR